MIRVTADLKVRNYDGRRTVVDDMAPDLKVRTTTVVVPAFSACGRIIRSCATEEDLCGELSPFY